MNEIEQKRQDVEGMIEMVKLMNIDSKMIAIGVTAGLKMASAFVANSSTQKTA